MGAVIELAAAFLKFAVSRFGLPVVAAIVGVAYGYHWAAKGCQARQEAAQAALLRAQLEERAREAQAAAMVAARDRARLSADADAQTAMQAEIDRLQAEIAKKEPADAPKNGPAARCVVDGDFARRVRQLERAGRRH
jgi:hypothetical protein